MILVDTCHWIEMFRTTGRPEVRERMRDLLRRNQAVWCDLVRLELWNTARADRDAEKLRKLEASIRSLPIDEPVWKKSVELAVQTRAKGWSVPATDLLIAACAARHGMKVESSDAHFIELNKLI